MYVHPPMQFRLRMLMDFDKTQYESYATGALLYPPPFKLTHFNFLHTNLWGDSDRELHP
jgi:hypothetical protein